MHAVKQYHDKPVSSILACIVKAKEVDGVIKPRLAFIMPLQVIVAEAMLFGTFIRDLPENWVPKPETHHKHYCGNKSISFDFKSFDASVSRHLIKAAFDVLFDVINWHGYEGRGIPTGLDRLFEYVESHYLDKHTITSRGNIWIRHGVPSGGYITNLLDTIISRIVLNTIHLPKCEHKTVTYGDDCHSTNCTCDPNVLVSRCKAFFGMDLKIIPPNELGCLTYCKSECINGQSFHSGQWYKDILDCCDRQIIPAVIQCLLHTRPTDDQRLELEGMLRKHVKIKVHPRMQPYIDRLRRYLACYNATSTTL